MPPSVTVFVPPHNRDRAGDHRRRRPADDQEGHALEHDEDAGPLRPPGQLRHTGGCRCHRQSLNYRHITDKSREKCRIIYILASPAKGVVVLKPARVQIPASPPIARRSTVCGFSHVFAICPQFALLFYELPTHYRHAFPGGPVLLPTSLPTKRHKKMTPGISPRGLVVTRSPLHPQEASFLPLPSLPPELPVSQPGTSAS